MSATSELISFVQGLDSAILSESVTRQVKRCVFDLLGVMIAGSQTRMADVSSRFAEAQFATGAATVVGSLRTLSPAGAVWVNGISASALDLDDGHREAMGHPGASVIPTALAIAETVHANGQDFLAAIVAGYEVAVRVSQSRTPPFKERLYNTGIWGGFGAVAAAAKLLRLDRLCLQYALGIVLAHSPFTPGGVQPGMTKEGIGWASMTGCAAALLAQQGFEGVIDYIDHSGRYYIDDLVKNLGEEYAILRTYFKPYAACRWSHPAIDGVLELRGLHDIKPQEVEAIRVEAFYETTRLSAPAPRTTIAAQFSIPFCLALALLYGKVGLGEMTEANLHEPEVLDLARKTTITIDPELDRQFPEKTATRIILDTVRGRFAQTVEYPKGSPENPLSDAELLAKFQAIASPLIGADRVTALKAAVDRLDQMDDVSELTSLLAF